MPCNAILCATDKTLRTELRTQSRDFEDPCRDAALEIAKGRGKLIEIKGSREREKKALEEEFARLAGVQAELDATQGRLQAEKDRVKRLGDANEVLGREIAELK